MSWPSLAPFRSSMCLPLDFATVYLGLGDKEQAFDGSKRLAKNALVISRRLTVHTNGLLCVPTRSTPICCGVWGLPWGGLKTYSWRVLSSFPLYRASSRHSFPFKLVPPQS